MTEQEIEQTFYCKRINLEVGVVCGRPICGYFTGGEEPCDFKNYPSSCLAQTQPSGTEQAKDRRPRVLGAIAETNESVAHLVEFPEKLKHQRQAWLRRMEQHPEGASVC